MSLDETRVRSLSNCPSRHGQSKPIQARDLLAPIYDWYTKDPDSIDLQEAKDLPDELSDS